MIRKAVATILLFFLTIVILVPYNVYAADPLSDLGKWVQDNILKPLGEMITGALKSIGEAIGSVFSSIAKTIGDAFTSLGKAVIGVVIAPAQAIMQAWNNANAALNSLLGPFSFLSPLILTLMFVAVVFVLYYVIKTILPII